MEPISAFMTLMFAAFVVWVSTGLLATLMSRDGYDNEAAAVLALLSTTAFFGMIAAGLLFLVMAIAKLVAGG